MLFDLKPRRVFLEFLNTLRRRTLRHYGLHGMLTFVVTKKAVTLLGVTAKILLRINVPSWSLVEEALIFLSSSSFLCLRRSDDSELLFQAGKVVERGSGVADFTSAELLCSD